MNRTWPVFAIAALASTAMAADRPRWHEQDAPTAAQLRDVSVVDARHAWVAGEDGVVLRTTDGGRRWRAVSVPDAADGISFRDVEAFSSRSALVLSTGPGTASRVYRTDDAGRSWQLQYQGREGQPGLACMGFWNPQQGVLLGEARAGRFQMRVTTDGGQHWTRVTKSNRPEALAGERILGDGHNCLAATGSGRIAFAAGGATSARLISSDDAGGNWRGLSLPHLSVISAEAVGFLLKGGHSGFTERGVSDTDAARQMAGLAADGALDRTALRRDGRVHWVGVGTDGSTLSDRSGKQTEAFASDAFAAVDGSANGALVLAVGNDGRIAQLRWVR